MGVDLFKCIAIIGLYFSIFYIVGYGFCKILKRDIVDENLILTGIFVYMPVFSLVTIFMKFNRLPLHVLTSVWWGLLLIYLMFVILRYRKDLTQISIKKISRIRENLKYSLIFVFVILLQVIIIEAVNITASPADTFYYVGTVNVDLFYDSLGIHNYLDGTILESFAGADFFETYLNHSAVMCKALKIHPLLEIRTINVAVIIIIYNVIIYEIGLAWFTNGRKPAVVLCSVCLLFNIFFTSFYMPGIFLITRTYEGKSILANVIISAIFLYMLKILKNHQNKFYWIQLLFVIMSAYTYSASATFIIPIILCAYFLVMIIYRKSLREFKYMILCSVYPFCMVLLTWMIQNNVIGKIN